MSGVEDEPGGVLDGSATGVEQRAVDVDDESALVTQEVEFVVAGQVVDRPAVAEVDVLDEPEAGERIERAVDGRPMHRRMLTGDVFSQVVRGRMVAGGHQGLDHRSPRLGQPPTGPTKPALDLLDTLHHTATVHTDRTVGWGFGAVLG